MINKNLGRIMQPIFDLAQKGVELVKENPMLTGAGILGAYGLWYMYRPRNMPPGPWGYPMVGSMFSMGAEPRVTMAELQKKYGDVFTLWMGGNRYHIIVNSYNAAKELVVTRGTTFAHRDQNEMGTNVGVEDDLFTADDHVHHKKARKTAMTSLKKSSDNNAWNCVFSEVYEHIIAKIEPDVKQPVEIESLIYDATTRIALKLLFGKYEKTDDPENKSCLTKLTKLVDQIQKSEVFSKLPYPLQYIVRPIVKKWQQEATVPVLRMIEKEVKEHLQAHNPSQSQDICDMFIAAGYHDPNNLTTNMYSLVPDSTITTAYVMIKVLTHLLQHLEYQGKMYQEISQITDGNPKQCILLEDRARLPLTVAFIEEVLRFAPAFDLSFGQRSNETQKFRGYTIPAKTSIILNFYAISHDPDHYQDPDKFWPERHLKLTGTESQETFAFSVGRRSCAGERLARAVLFFLLANLVKDFEIVPLEDASDNNDTRKPLSVFLRKRDTSLV